MVDPDIMFCKNKAWFHLSSYVKSRNKCYWSAENSTLHSWGSITWCENGCTVCDQCAHRITGTVFFQETTDSEKYDRLILTPSFSKLTEKEKIYGNFTQDNATEHTANHSMEEINQVFSNHIVSRRLWSPWYPDLNPCFFYLRGKLTMCT
jgi:hypothetical protein